MKTVFGLVLGVLAVSLLCGEVRGEVQVLGIRPRVEANGPQILLADVAQNAEELPEEWRKRVVMEAPAPGKRRTYTLTSLAYALQQYPDMHSTSLRGPLQLEVRRQGRLLGEKKVKDALSAYVRSAAPWQGKEVLVELETWSDMPVVSETNVAVRVTGHTEERGRKATQFDVVVETPGVDPRTCAVYANVEIMEEVWTAATFLDRGTVVKRDDLEAAIRSRDEIRESHIPVSDSIAGLEIVRSLRPGEAISRHHLRQPVCVESGEVLSVSAQRGPVEVRLRAKALGRGRRGERILCVNEQSKRKLLVRLTGPREAVIENRTM